VENDNIHMFSQAMKLFFLSTLYETILWQKVIYRKKYIAIDSLGPGDLSNALLEFQVISAKFSPDP
jgi:hypothetical protein